MAKPTVILLMLLLLGCEEKQECDAVCEIRKADFELLTMRVYFENYAISFHAYKTASGAVAGYKHEWEWLEAELSPEEWQGFIKDLYKCLDNDLNEWGGEDRYSCGTFRCKRLLYIDYKADSMYGFVRHRTWHAKPTDWDKVEKTIDGMR